MIQEELHERLQYFKTAQYALLEAQRLEQRTVRPRNA